MSPFCRYSCNGHYSLSYKINLVAQYRFLRITLFSGMAPTLLGRFPLLYTRTLIQTLHLFLPTFPQMYQIAYVIVKAAISPRPGNWILERSIDGVHYTPWQYYAVSDAECLQRYGIQPRRGKPTYRHDSEVICTSYYSKLNPLEGGEIHTSLVNGRPGAAEGSEELKEFTKARYVRMRLQKIRTLNADLMGSHLGRGEDGSRGEGRRDNVNYEYEDEDEEEEEDDEDYIGREDRLRADPSVTRRYFYSIKDISIGGRCVCNGHARDCTVDTESGLRKCRCEHNACGEGCEQCCPLFNQRPWQPGVPCQSCHCHGHAPACKYDPEVARARASMDPDGVYRGGGGAHTTGVNCEKCQDGWYRPSGVSASDSNPCRACRCHPTGSISPNCASHNDPSGAPPGSCICRPGFTGPRCDRCAAGRRRFPECEACMCDPAGSQGNDPCPPRDPQHGSGSRSSLLLIQRNVEGPLCNRCRKGFFALQESNPLGCTPCYCSGLTPECQEDDTLKLTASSSLSNWLVTDLRGRRVSIPSSISAAEANKDPLPLDIGPDEDLLRYELSRPDPARSPEANDTDGGRRLSIANDDMGGLDSYYWQAPPGEMFLGEKLATYGQNITVGVSWVTARGDTGGHPTNGPDIILEGGGYTIAYGEAAYPGLSNTTLVIPLAEDAVGPLGQDWYHVSPGANDIARSSRRTDYRTNEVVTRDQMMKVLGDLKRLLVRAKFHTDQIEGGLWEPSIQMGSAAVDTGPPARRIEICRCPPGYEGASCQHCSYGYVRVSGRYGPECRQCDCNGHAATCDPVTGRCARCEHNTYGEHCEYCSTGFFGDARVGTPDDCQQCRCPHHVKSNNFSPTCERREGAPSGYICTRLRTSHIYPPNDTNQLHSRCGPGHFGNPMEIGSVCRPCQCGSGSTSSGMMMVGGRLTPIHCDSLTGRCLDCKGNTEGWNCERCKPLHYGDPAHADCRPCSCNAAGTGGVASCDPRTGQCRCLEGYTGRTCDRCKEGRGGISLGCPPCDCDPMGTTLAFGGRTQCDPRTGQCPCRAGAAGRRCESCIPNYYHSPSDGCKSEYLFQ
ncbi:hypothetical protein J437_LFUL010340 [Ladona fulva]|uniref:Laminin subunit alpha-1 n=1 Tax=Ladona fulva TaxID=123851 RepID=A0A8K0JVV6_LADFU|nr:hypothetical protein J437_LFUL010340 [Ladona fulva]